MDPETPYHDPVRVNILPIIQDATRYKNYSSFLERHKYVTHQVGMKAGATLRGGNVKYFFDGVYQLDGDEAPGRRSRKAWNGLWGDSSQNWQQQTLSNGVGSPRTLEIK